MGQHERGQVLHGDFPRGGHAARVIDDVEDIGKRWCCERRQRRVSLVCNIRVALGFA